MSVFRRAAERRGTPADSLVVGLGNPGPDYVGTRHNVGVEVVEALAARHHTSLDALKRERAMATTTTIAGARVALAVPLTFMNLSGEAVSRLVKRYGITEPADIVVVHDELDLEPGRLKVKLGGGAAGNNGVSSVISHLGTRDFVRIRVGVGKPPHPRAGKDWVLKRPSAGDRAALDDAVERAVDCVEEIVRNGAESAMNRFNGT